jgi:hypothetical protein
VGATFFNKRSAVYSEGKRLWIWDCHACASFGKVPFALTCSQFSDFPTSRILSNKCPFSVDFQTKQGVVFRISKGKTYKVPRQVCLVTQSFCSSILRELPKLMESEDFSRYRLKFDEGSNTPPLSAEVLISSFLPKSSFSSGVTSYGPPGPSPISYKLGHSL